jgi:hypothetical protein
MNQKGKFYVLVIIILIAGGLATSWALDNIKKRYPEVVDKAPAVRPSPTPSPVAPASPVATSSLGSVESQILNLKSYLLRIPWTSQAPKGNWEGIYEDGCEEASVIMAAEYLRGNTETNLNVDFVMGEIQRLADWETEQFGYNLSTNNSEVMRMAEKVYGLKAKVISNFTEDDIKRELLMDHVVIVPAQGQQLGNPNFRGSGPPYHMFVIKGWNTLGFVTNEPGTRKGLNYLYSFDTIYNATGEYQHSTKSVDTSVKDIIVVYK